MSALRVGIAGYGLAGEVFHAPLVDAVDGLEVAGIVTSSPERQARARAAYPDAAVVADLDALWGEIDVLVVAAPNRAHVALALAGLERELAVVVDKPIAPSVAEAERLLAAGGALTVFQNRRWDGDFLTVRRLVEEDALGEIVRFESRFERFRPEVQGDRWRELPDAAEGGGLLLDLGPHLVDQARVLLGHPLRVYAEVRALRPGAQVDDDVFIALEHPGGATSQLWMSMVAPLHGPRFRVSGRRAGFATDGLDPQEPQLRAGRRPRDPDYGHGRDGRLVDVGGERRVRLDRGGYQVFYERVRDWLRGDGPVPVDPADSVAGLRVLEAARRSAAKHAVVEVQQ
ncbi:MAG TPA: Gfo/Idh/MocA family oxidoreductase [Solirubrobacteraceae bacterium]